jgi:hypothetical protein
MEITAMVVTGTTITYDDDAKLLKFRYRCPTCRQIGLGLIGMIIRSKL